MTSKFFYDTLQLYLGPRHQRYCFENLDLSEYNRDSVIEFEANFEERSVTKAVSFLDSKSIDFIPLSLLRQFKNLNGLEVLGSNLKILKDGLFTTDFRMIQYIFLGFNRIQTIEAAALSSLTELKWISLSSNRIEEIPHKIFEKNLKLEFIAFSCNQIYSVHPELFDGLASLKEIWFDGNPVVSKKLKILI